MNKSLEYLQTVAAIADTSESAEGYWGEIATTIQRLIEALPEHTLEMVYLLGSQSVLPKSYFASNNTPKPARSSSFVTPVIKKFQRERTKVQVALIIGAGEVFDLADWISSSGVQQWALVDVGEATLKPANVEIPVFNRADLTPLFAWLSTIFTEKEPRKKRPLSTWSSGSGQWLLDEVGYPLVYIPPINGYFHLFPITKPHFEEFLVENFSNYNDIWYQQLLTLNPRLSYRASNYDNYEQLLLSAIVPSEAQRFAQWLGRGYKLPTVKDWQTAYQWLAQQKASPPQPQLEQGMAEAAHEIWEGLYYHLSPKTLLELSLMPHGVIEWVTDNGKYVGLGRTRPEFIPQLRNPLTPVPPIDITARIKEFGFRLQR